MRLRSFGCVVAALIGAGAGCNPYQNFSGEFYAGPVDPAKFPKDFLGGGDPKMGGGMFSAASGVANGKPVLYYPFASASDPTVLVDPTAMYTVPPAFVFDANASMSNPFPGAKCTAPPNYTFDLRTDAFALNDQGNIFTELPGQSDMNGNPYVPVVAEVPVSAAGQPCQAVKTAKTVEKAPYNAPTDSMGNPKGDGNFLAWAVIDPSADVTPNDPMTFFGVSEHWGWFNHYLLAYIDGGYIPTMTNQMGQTVAVTQNVYVADMTTTDPMTMKMVAVPNSGTPGMGGDVFDAARGEKGYSPICVVKTYDPTAVTGTPSKASDIPMAAIDPDPSTGPTFIYCLQVAQ